MITPEIKDKILSFIVLKDKIRFEIRIESLANELDISPDIISAIVQYFSRIGLLQINKEMGFMGKETFDITMNVEAYDLYHEGGFTFQEEILKAQLNKLDEELSLLKKKTTDSTLSTIEKMISIVGTILKSLPLDNRN